MSNPYLGEIKMVGFNFPPRGWALCDGATLPINSYQSLYSLLGTMYGGDGRTSFMLPDLRGRVPQHFGNGYTEAQKGGQEDVFLTPAEIPQHRHAIESTTDNATVSTPAGNVFARATTNVYHGYNASNNQVINSDALAPAGGGQAHNNMQPYLAIYFCIAITGMFPSRN